jgi:deoxyadenosine/deoxycytidine kinase
MQNNLFFLCGPHGSGKTTLSRELEKEGIVVPELYSRNIKFDISPKERLLLKICGRSVENFEYLQIARKNPDKIILGNRCIYDQQVYDQVYYERGWISGEDFYLSNVLALNFYIEELRNPFAVVLNPGFEVVLEHLKKRWREKGKKWREDDLEYTRFACGAYESLQGRERVFYIDHEIDLKSQEDVREVSEWINKISKRELVKI